MIYYFEEKMRRQDYDTKLFATKAATYFSSESLFNLYTGRSSDSSIFSSLPMCNWQTVASIAENNIRLSIGITATGIVPGLHRIPF